MASRNEDLGLPVRPPVLILLPVPFKSLSSPLVSPIEHRMETEKMASRPPGTIMAEVETDGKVAEPKILPNDNRSATLSSSSGE